MKTIATLSIYMKQRIFLLRERVIRFCEKKKEKKWQECGFASLKNSILTADSGRRDVRMALQKFHAHLPQFRGESSNIGIRGRSYVSDRIFFCKKISREIVEWEHLWMNPNRWIVSSILIEDTFTTDWNRFHP